MNYKYLYVLFRKLNLASSTKETNLSSVVQLLDNVRTVVNILEN